MFLVHKNLYKQMNNEIIRKGGNYLKTIKRQGPFHLALVRLSHRKE